MSYLKRPDVPVEAGETACEIAGGVLVAVRVEVSRDETTNVSVYQATARVVDGDGAAVLDANGKLLRSTATYAANAALVDATVGAFGVLREMALLVLGEPGTVQNGQPVIEWSDDYRRDAAIATAIAAAQRTGAAPIHMLL